MRPARSLPEGSDERVGAVHRPADRDDPADDRSYAAGAGGVFRSADRRRAAGRRPDHTGEREPSRSQRRDHGDLGGRAARSSVVADFGRHLDQLHELARSDPDPGRIRSRTQPRGRRPGRPDRDQRRRRAAAEEPAQSSDLREGQSRRRAPDVDRDHVGRSADLCGRRVCRELPRAADLPHSRRRPRRLPRPAEAGHSHPDQPDGRFRHGCHAGGRPRGGGHRHGQLAQRHARRRAAVDDARHHRSDIRCRRPSIR